MTAIDPLRSHEQPRSGHSKLDIRRTRKHYKRCFAPPLRGEVMRLNCDTLHASGHSSHFELGLLQDFVSISRYIVVAVVRCSRASRA